MLASGTGAFKGRKTNGIMISRRMEKRVHRKFANILREWKGIVGRISN